MTPSPHHIALLSLLLVVLPGQVFANPISSDIELSNRLDAGHDARTAEENFLDKRVKNPFKNPFSCFRTEISEDENDASDGPTPDGSPGLGVELETSDILADVEEACTEDITKFKGSSMANRKGTNWALTADTSIPGYLTAEYIINGRTVKIGQNLARPAARAIAADLADWNPKAGDSVTIGGSKCRWRLKSPAQAGRTAEMSWSPQLTAPMPMEAINDIIAKGVAGQPSQFVEGYMVARLVSVTTAFFHSEPAGLGPGDVSQGLLGFFSLVVGYAKGATDLGVDESPKYLSPIMPRTNFVGLWKQVSSEFGDKRLWDVVKVLMCYENTADGVAIDDSFCSGSTGNPVLGSRIDDQRFSVEARGKDRMYLSVKDWINSIQSSPTVDKLTTLDAQIDKSIGYFKLKTETLYGGTRKVPLFEFRNLLSISSGGFEEFVGNSEDAVIEYHQKFRNKVVVARAMASSCPTGYSSTLMPNDPTSTGVSNGTATTLPTGTGAPPSTTSSSVAAITVKA